MSGDRPEGGAAMIAVTPSAIRPPFARYSHALIAPPGWRVLAISGQLGVGADDSAPEGAGAQAALCFGNINAILAEAGGSRAHILRVSAFVTGREHMAPYMRARDEFLAGVTPPPASTLMIVSGFTRPEFLVEVEALAALPPL